MRRILVTAAALCFATPGLAADFELRATALQADFELISGDLAAAINHKALGPAEATGLTGVSVGAFASYVATEDADAWGRATGKKLDALPVAGLHATKGLPFGVDVGLAYSTLTGGASVLGAELRYAILEGSAVTPALAVRAAYSRLDGVDSYDLNSRSLDVSISKGFGPATPYAGVGRIDATAEPGAVGLRDVDVKETRLFAGLRLGLGLLDMIPEYEKIGDHNTFSFKLGLSL